MATRDISYNILGLAVGDFNSDGVQDLAAVNGGNSNSSRPRDQREHHQQYHSSNPHFQDQRREFSSHMGSQGERQSSSSSSFGGGRGRGRRGA